MILKYRLGLFQIDNYNFLSFGSILRSCFVLRYIIQCFLNFVGNTTAVTANPGPSHVISHPALSGLTRAAQATTPSQCVTQNNPALAVAQEHRRLFNYRSSSGKSKKKGKRSQTCTLKFLCMSKTDSVKPPTTVKERAQLANAGLGERSIQFELNEGSRHCHERILQAFPKLSGVGYELLLFQRGEGGGFCNLAGPYTPRKLKDASAHSKIYIRPLLKDLEVDEVDGPEEEVSVGFLRHQWERLRSQNSIVVADKIWPMIYCTKLSNITNLYIVKLTPT